MDANLVELVAGLALTHDALHPGKPLYLREALASTVSMPTTSRSGRRWASCGAGTGSFIFGPPTKANPIEVEDCLVLPNFDLPAGMSVMGIWRELAVWMHEGISIAPSDSHDTYFVENLVAILAELRRRRRHGDGRVLRD